MSSKLEPAILAHDTGQWIRCFDRCQLTITWMSNIKEGCYKPRLHVSVNLLAGVGCHCKQLHRCCCLQPLAKTRRPKIVSRASAMSIEHLLCATVPKIAFVIVLKDACLKEISCNCNHTEIGVSLFTVKVSH